MLRTPPSVRDPSFFGGENGGGGNLPHPIHPLLPPWTSAAERLGHCTVRSNVYFEYLNYVLVISLSELNIVKSLHGCILCKFEKIY